MKYLAGLVSILILLVAAYYYFFSSPPKMDEETFVNFYYDLVVSQDTTSYSPDATQRILSSLYEKYNIDETIYLNTIDYYKKNGERWENFFTAVMKKIEDKQKELNSGTSTQQEQF